MQTKADRIAGEVRQRKTVRPKDLSSLEGSRSHFWNLARSGKIERIGRGLYRHRSFSISDKEVYIELAKRVPRAFFACPMRFLVYGNDEMLIITRGLLFEQAGYEVFTPRSLSNAALALMNHEIDILLLCQTLSEQERSAVLETAHTLQPRIKSVLLA
jgi:hypothetical protein